MDCGNRAWWGSGWPSAWGAGTPGPSSAGVRLVGAEGPNNEQSRPETITNWRLICVRLGKNGRRFPRGGLTRVPWVPTGGGLNLRLAVWVAFGWPNKPKLMMLVEIRLQCRRGKNQEAQDAKDKSGR